MSTDAMKKTFILANNMACISRFSQSHLAKDESVLEHTAWVSLIAYRMAIELNAAGENLLIGMLLEKALVHDVDEVITGDIPRPTKYAYPELTEAMHRLEETNMGKISEDVFETDRPYIAWSESKLGKEGFLVKISDSMAVINKAWLECHKFGNNSINSYGKGAGNNLTRALDSKEFQEFKNTKIVHKFLSQAIEIAYSI